MPTTPDAPTGVSAVAGNAQATVSFTATDNAVAAGVTGYTVTATDSTNSGRGGQTATGAASPITVTGLTNGDSYVFTVVANGSSANSAPSTASNSVIPVTVPGAPTGVTAQAGNTAATVTFVAPASNGGNPITSYTVTAQDLTVPGNGGQRVTGSGSPLSLAGLTNGDSYVFTVIATNNVGASAASSPSAPIIPALTSVSTTPPAPYPNALQFAVTKAINLTQLDVEMQAALGVSVNLALNGSNYTPPPSSISPSNPATLWVVPNTVSSSAVQTVINNHVANPNYGLPQQTQDFLTLIAAIQANNAITLTSTQINTGLVGVILQLASLVSGGNFQINP